VQGNGGVVEIAQNMHTECIDDAVRDENGCVDADSFGGCGFVGGFHGCGGGNQTCETEGYTSCDGDLAEEIEPIEFVRDGNSEHERKTYHPVTQAAKAECLAGASMAAQ
jgi:hypothetical protein